MSVQQQLPQQLQALSPRDVVVRLDEGLVVREDFVIVLLQKLTRHYFVSREQLPEGGECVARYVEHLQLHVLEEQEEIL